MNKVETIYKEEDVVNEGTKILQSMSEEDASLVIETVKGVLILEIKMGLGLVETPNEFDDDDYFGFFERVDGLYRSTGDGCYFCDKSIDPNDFGFDENAEICPICQLKLANIFTYENISLNKKYIKLAVAGREKQRKRGEFYDG